MTDRQQPDTAVVVIAWVVTAFTAGYMLPWAIAATRGKANQGSVALINALVGWSLIGWVVALVMACQAHQVVRAPVAMNVVVAQQFPQTYATGSYPQAGPPPGWYPAPDGYGRQYWDGIAWTAHRAQ
ncbi:MAG: superinfection immunity protein [Cellulomonadaceae bacterium]|nr:superinfection immunity protein [Cellulomonadaceae bacterium]